ncbi:DUF943 family protein [Kosakonia oryziphila]|jgi:Enterobacterial putative membrane protein (DUF943).|uniref:Putative membrane protein n=1 Tax=Kosakonia oryziphila TaxID=1005667 RepID=A0A1C4FWD5_9ENTR|nr:DUF943 family protein [Kosakonia oryziphila]SCC60327.1 putative membrane protein [Kosakonia oryziphila]
MRVKNKKTIMVLAVAGCVLLAYWLWLSLRPVEIVAIHHRSSGFSDVLVTNFPPTDKGKINWWLKNKDMLKDKYAALKTDSDGSFYITFWLFGDGYKEEGKYDRLCFSDMKVKENCIDKNRVFSVETVNNGDTFFTVSDAIYLMENNGEMTKVKYK